jgi:aspartate 1-decarboxylase
MRRRLLRSKIHRATITSADLHYHGSLTLDSTLMAAADLVEFEEIQVVNVNNGSRLSTYVIPGPADSGVVQLNGAAARNGMAGDLVIIMAYADLEAEELRGFVPQVVYVDGKNKVVRPPLTMES